MPELNEENSHVLSSRRLREARKRKGLTLREASEKLNDGTHFTTLGKLERGTMTLSFEWAHKLAAIYDVAPADLWLMSASSEAGKRVPAFIRDDPANEGLDYREWRQFGWFYTAYGGANSIAIMFPLVEDDSEKMVEHYAVVDMAPDIFSDSRRYAIKVIHPIALNKVFIGKYSDADQSFTGIAPFDEGRIRMGEVPFERIGRVVLLAEAFST